MNYLTLLQAHHAKKHDFCTKYLSSPEAIDAFYAVLQSEHDVAAAFFDRNVPAE